MASSSRTAASSSHSRSRAPELRRPALAVDHQHRFDLATPHEDHRRHSARSAKEALGESFAAAGVFIVSLQRGLAGYIVPSKLYGILAAGRPFVAAVEESCEVASIAATHQCGLLAEPGDATALAARIREFHADREMTARFGANARAVGVSFDRRLQVARYMDVFRRVRPTADVQQSAPIEGEVAR